MMDWLLKYDCPQDARGLTREGYLNETKGIKLFTICFITAMMIIIALLSPYLLEKGNFTGYLIILSILAILHSLLIIRVIVIITTIKKNSAFYQDSDLPKNRFQAVSMNLGGTHKLTRKLLKK